MSIHENSTSTQPGLTVIKLGGSLLEWPELPRRLAAFLDECCQARGPSRPPFTLIAGGGRTADLIPTMDRIHGLGDERGDWLAIDALELNARILASVLPGCVVVDRPEAIDPVCDRGQIPVLAPRR